MQYFFVQKPEGGRPSLALNAIMPKIGVTDISQPQTPQSPMFPHLYADVNDAKREYIRILKGYILLLHYKVNEIQKTIPLDKDELLEVDIQL